MGTREAPMAVPTLSDADAFAKAISTECLVHFAADWYEPCKHMNELLAQRVATDSRLPIFTLDAESMPELAEKHSITSVPIFIVFKGGKEQGRLEGVNAPELISLLDKHSAHAGAPSAAGVLENVKGDLNLRLGALTSRAPVMLFMKGDVAAPKCKFSRAMVELLNQ